MEEVLDTYEREYDEHHPVIALDEARKQLVSHTQKPFVDSKGVRHYDYEYKREGVAVIYMITQAFKSRREVLIQDEQTAKSYAQVITHIAEQMYPDALRITIVQDNLSTHAKHALYQIHEPERARNILRRLEFVYTPKHGSWLNIAEIELSVLSRQCLSERIPDKETLQKQIKAWQNKRNNLNAQIDWQFTTKQARTKLKQLYPKLEP
jgi:transposase